MVTNVYSFAETYRREQFPLETINFVSIKSSIVS